MNKTIIFISGWAVPKWIAKTQFVWDESYWSDYRRLWITSKTPTSDSMVEKELDRLQRLIEIFPGAAVAGQSLGGWWGANLALRPQVIIKKLVLWTPLGNTRAYPIFRASGRYHPLKQTPTNNFGPNRVLTVMAKDDLMVPPQKHGIKLSQHFNSMNYNLDGGHLYQTNHQAALQYMKDWIEVQ